MRYLWLPTQSPYFNLAAEEYLLKQTNDDIFMLWQNANAIIVGKHQNTLAEINQDYVQSHHITVARRITGGGAVFHDLGNLNFTFIQNIQPQDKEVNFVRYLQPIVDALKDLGLPATFSGRNDILLDGKKISGNAMAFHENRVLEHGCMLFSTLHNDLVNALNVDPEKFADKAVKSVRSRVTNISEHLATPMTVLEFKDYLMNFIKRQDPTAIIEQLSDREIAVIQQLEKEKYSTWEWNFGQSPRYSINRKVRTQGGSIQAMMNVKNGRIQELQFFGDFFSTKDPTELAARLVGLPHEQAIIQETLNDLPVEQYFSNATKEELLGLLV